MVAELFGVNSFWVDLIVFAAGQALQLSPFCTTDPPAMPNFTAQDIADILASFPASNRPGFLKLITLAQILAWYTYCECSTGSPTPVVQPTPPSTAPNPQTPGQDNTPTQVNGACFEYSDIFNYTVGNGLAPNIGSGSTRWSSRGITSVQITTQLTVLNGSGSTSTFSFQQEGFNGQNLPPPPVVWNLPASGTDKRVVTLDPNYDAGVVTVTNPGTTGQTNIHLIWDYFCGGTGPNTENTPCCPPDPNVTMTLQQIINMLTTIFQELNKTPQYTKGVVHAGITGEGSFSVSQLFGMQAVLTTGVPTTPELPGVPPYEFSVGWMSVLTPDGMIDEIRLTRQNQVWGSRLFPFGTTFGYHLNPGFTANFTELLPA